jgi:deoxyribodipyrimidine photolyase-related protein
MSTAVSLVFPHQLFHDHPALDAGREVWMVEDPLFFTQYIFHKKKLVFHRASMMEYKEYLEHHGFRVRYIEISNSCSSTEGLFGLMKRERVKKVVCCDPVDYLLTRRLTRYAQETNTDLEIVESPNFLNSDRDVKDYFADHRFFMHDFYVHQRKRTALLLDAAGKPLGGKWTFDADNRQRMPAGTTVPPLPSLRKRATITEAEKYVNKHFAQNYGDAEGMIYPVTREEALDWLITFCKERFYNYGTYQDAIVKGEPFLFHSLLTPMLNAGIIQPNEVLSTAMEIALRDDVPMNALEGFVRQVLGWREYIRAVYVCKGVEERTRNYWNHHRKIPASFWNGTTGIPPIDDMVKRTLKHAYAHHIERLMIAGNFMLLCEFDPDEVYRWFMELFIDAYDWVMVPNVYGMALHADGGMMSTKPYISGSNYVLKMSNYTKGPWCEIWDGLFWRFIEEHKDFFSANFRLNMMVRALDKMDSGKRTYLSERASAFLQQLDATP